MWEQRKIAQFRTGGLGSVSLSWRKDVKPEGRIGIIQSKWPEEGERKRENSERE